MKCRVGKCQHEATRRVTIAMMAPNPKDSGVVQEAMCEDHATRFVSQMSQPEYLAHRIGQFFRLTGKVPEGELIVLSEPLDGDKKPDIPAVTPSVL